MESNNDSLKKKKSDYMKKYWEKNKDKLKEQRKKFKEQHPDYQKQYYQKNKERILQVNKQWQLNNKQKFIQLCQNSRKRRIERLRAEGCINSWSVIVHHADPKYGDTHGNNRTKSTR